MHKLLGTLALAGFVAVPAFAQDAEVDFSASGKMGARTALPIDPTVDPATLGDQTFGPIDVGAAIGETGVLGVQYLNGQYFVTSRVLTGDGLNRVYVFDGSGNLVDEFVQQFGAELDAWGYRDGASDGTFLYFGWGGGIARHEASPPYTGTRIVSGGGPNGTWRALAYDPDGNNGAGSLYSTDFGDSIVEITLTGSVLRTLPNLDAWSIYGLAFDHTTGNLWASDYDYSLGTGGLPPTVCEIDTNIGRKTGTCFENDYGVPGNPGFPIHGGLTEVVGGAGGSGNELDVVALLQALSDTLVGSEVVAGSAFSLSSTGNCPGTVTFTLAGGTPGGNGALVYGLGTGPTTIPSTFPCAGTVLNVGNPQLDFQTVRFDANGVATLSTFVPTAACSFNVQGLDLGTCATSNVINP